MDIRYIHRVGMLVLILAGSLVLASCAGGKKEPAETSAADTQAADTQAADLQAADDPATGALTMPDYDMEIRGRIARFEGGTVMLLTDSNGPIVLGGEMNFDGLGTGDDVTIYCTGIKETYPAQTTVVEMILHGRGSTLDLPADAIQNLAGLNYILEQTDSSDAIKNDEIITDNIYISITMEELKERLAEEEGYILLDVRRLDEYTEGHLPGAINVANEDIGTEQPDDLPDPDQKIYVYCRSGNRSKDAAQKLVDMGYTDIVECGGIQDWTGEIEK